MLNIYVLNFHLQQGNCCHQSLQNSGAAEGWQEWAHTQKHWLTPCRSQKLSRIGCCQSHLRKRILSAYYFLRWADCECSWGDRTCDPETFGIQVDDDRAISFLPHSRESAPGTTLEGVATSLYHTVDPPSTNNNLPIDLKEIISQIMTYL